MELLKVVIQTDDETIVVGKLQIEEEIKISDKSLNIVIDDKTMADSSEAILRARTQALDVTDVTEIQDAIAAAILRAESEVTTHGGTLTVTRINNIQETLQEFSFNDNMSLPSANLDIVSKKNPLIFGTSNLVIISKDNGETPLLLYSTEASSL